MRLRKRHSDSVRTRQQLVGEQTQPHRRRDRQTDDTNVPRTRDARPVQQRANRRARGHLGDGLRALLALLQPPSVRGRRQVAHHQRQVRHSSRRRRVQGLPRPHSVHAKH